MKWNKRDASLTIEEVVCRNLGIDDISTLAEWEQKSKQKKYTLSNLDEAVELIASFKGKPIYIVGDYDVDGRMASIIMYLALVDAGYSKLHVRIPRRFSEGYGMKKNMIDEFLQPGLIITVDNGITAFDAVSYAKEKGFAVLVTDHHLPMSGENGVCLPAADVIVDPHAISGSDYDGYCGAGIAYKIAEAILGSADKYLPFASVATIADIMDLREENRVYTKRGLQMMTDRNAAPGLLAMMDGMNIQTCDATSVGFKIAPAINAPGRMNDIDMDTLKLLASKDIVKARGYMEYIIRVNELRKIAVSEGVQEAKKMVQDGTEIIILYLERAARGVLGIIAGRLSDEYHVPAIVFGKGDGVLVGSARSVPEINIVELLEPVRGILSSLGGHAQACGLSIKEELFPAFKESVIKLFRETGYEYREAEFGFYDLEIAEDEVLTCLEKQDAYEPYGHGNEKPVYKIRNFRLVEPPRAIAGNGVRMKSGNITAVGFGLWPMLTDTGIATYDLYGTLSWNEYRGFRTPQIELVGFEKTSEMKETAFAKKLKAI